MTSDPHALFVAWQHPMERSCHVVGRLRKILIEERLIYEFVYVNEARRAQEAHGFLPFISFPELETTYHGDTLFPFFQNRIMRSKRPDYPAYIQELGLTREDATPERILSRSGGRRVTDHVEIFAPPQHNPENGLDEMYFLLRGLREMPHGTEDHITKLERGAQLSCMLDFQNRYNHRAVMLRTDDNCLLGYIPDYLTDDVALLRENNAPLVVQAERVNPPPAPQAHRLLCRLQATWPAGQEPFTDERFQPLVSSVDDASAAERVPGAAPA